MKDSAAKVGTTEVDTIEGRQGIFVTNPTTQLIPFLDA